MANDRGDSHRHGARGARPLQGRLDYIRDRIVEAGVLVIEAARDADATPRTRWATAELADIGRDLATLVARARELRAQVMDKSGAGHELGAPVPLSLKSTDKRLGDGT